LPAGSIGGRAALRNNSPSEAGRHRCQRDARYCRGFEAHRGVPDRVEAGDIVDVQRPPHRTALFLDRVFQQISIGAYYRIDEAWAD